MNEPKPFASLSPSLLARKGSARPAMRPQYQAFSPAHQETAARQLEEDLGWNDMGHEPEETKKPAAADIVAIKPAASLLPAQSPVARPPVAQLPVVQPPVVKAPEAPKVPEVVRQQIAIADRIAEAPVPAETSVDTAASRALDIVRRSALADGRRAAFTLRLDAERHLKLRLACTISNRSAQQVVTDALDKFIADLPEVADLAAQVRKRG